MIRTLFALFLAFGSTSVSGQTVTPYAGMEFRPVKALSDVQIADLRAGRGMGLALAAELNGYPGPTHVLELSDRLNLSTDQAARTKKLLDAMKAETIPLGERVIEQEAALEKLFAERSITEEGIRAGVQAAAMTQSDLRAAHLKYHLSTLEILTPTQVDRYAELRGYRGAQPATGHDPKHHH